jgi:hypothetical protein
MFVHLVEGQVHHPREEAFEDKRAAHERAHHRADRAEFAKRYQ